MDDDKFELALCVWERDFFGIFAEAMADGKLDRFDVHNIQIFSVSNFIIF